MGSSFWRCRGSKRPTGPAREPDVAGTPVAGSPMADAEEPVPVTVWPLPAGPGGFRSCRGRAGGSADRPMTGVLARVLACYARPGTRVLVDVFGARPAPEGAERGGAGQADLIVVVPDPSDPAAVVEAYRHLLGPAGLLAVVLPSTIDVDITIIIAAARAAGLRYLQHNVAFPANAGGAPASVAGGRACRVGRLHRRVHTDVLVFATPSRLADPAGSPKAGDTDG